MNAVILSAWLIMTPAPDFYGVPGCAWSYEPIVAYYADANLVPRSLAMAIIREESHFKPSARSREWKEHNGVWEPGKVLARGLMQISVQYEDEHVINTGLQPAKIERWFDWGTWWVVRSGFEWNNPAHSLRVGMYLLRTLLDRYNGDQLLAVAAFNCGTGRLESWREIPRETLKYLKGVLG